MIPQEKVAAYPEKVLWLLLVCLNAGIPATEVWEYHIGKVDTTAALLSGVIVLVFLNTTLLLAFRIRSKREGWPLKGRLVGGAAVLATVAFLLTILGVSLVKQRNNYMELAVSNTPLSSIEPEQKRLVVELIRRTAAISQEENKEMAEALKVPMNPVVYAPESFANRQTIQTTLARLTNYADIDFRYFDKQQSARADFRQKMAACDAEYLKKWNAERREQEDREKSANQLEHDWLASVTSLYGYAAQHSSDIAVGSGKIVIVDGAVRRRFNELSTQSKTLHEKLESSVQEEVKNQQQAKARIAD